jgi:hypothetical protein
MSRIVLIIAACLAATAARAETRTIQAEKVASITIGGDVSANVDTDASLNGSIRLIGDALDCVSVTEGVDAQINTSGCGDSLGHLTVLLPRDLIVRLTHDSGETVSVGNIDGPVFEATVNRDGDLKIGNARTLQLTVHGSGDTTVGSTSGALSLRLDGSGNVHLNEARGVVDAQLHGSGDLTIGSIDGAAANFTINGSGNVRVENGSISALKGVISGSGDMVIGGTVSVADLSANGGGDIHVTRVTGVIHRHASGGSDIVVNESAGSDIEGSIERAVDNANFDASNGVHVVVGHSVSNVLGHVIAGIITLLLLFFAWRTIQRHGGLQSWTQPRGRGVVTEPTNPDVLAVRDRLARLDARLGRVEGYVTSREFELQRKFRELEK